jgi:hypothetical protein
MNLTPLQSKFSAGELSPLMRNRSDAPGYDSAVEIMENMISVAQGPTKNREPFVYLTEFVGETEGRILIIQISANEFIVGIFINLKVVFFFSDGSPMTAVLNTNPRFFDAGTGWTTVTVGIQSFVIFGPGTCNLSPGTSGGALAGIKQNVTLSDGGILHDFIIVSDVEDVGGDILTISIGTSDGGNELYQGTTTIDSTRVSFDPLGNTDIWIQVSNGNVIGGGQAVQLNTFAIVASGQSALEFATPYPADALEELQFIESPEGTVVYIAHQQYPQHKVSFDYNTFLAAFGIVTFTAPPAEWVANNYPGTGAIFGGRVWYAGSPNQPEQFWAGQVGDHEDMTTGTAENDGFSVVNEHFGRIVWMLATKELTAGSSNAEYLISSDGPAIFIGDIQLDRQSAYGSTSERSKLVGDKILYITRDSRRLHAMQFDRDSQVWLSEEISFPSEHITEPLMHGFARQQWPGDLLWFPLKDGTAAACSYNRPMQVYGWHQHNTEGKIVDMESGELTERSVLLMLVVRSSGNLGLEHTSNTGTPVDSRISVQLEPPSVTVTGLDHLEGNTVQVIADNTLHPDRVVAGGEITLQRVAAFVQVGLGYRKRVKTLPFDKGSQKGSARAYMKRYKDIYLALLDSAVPHINGQLPPIRTPPVPMGEAPPLTTGLIKVSNLGFDLDAPVDIIQDGPLPLQITGIYGEVVQEKL